MYRDRYTMPRGLALKDTCLIPSDVSHVLDFHQWPERLLRRYIIYVVNCEHLMSIGVEGWWEWVVGVGGGW